MTPARTARPATTYRRVPRTPALDGLRALAIAAVALFHFPTRSVFMGGLFGVGLFFVLSGFLVTPILAAEHSREGRIRFGRYLRRRAWRLLPALGAFVLVVVVMTALFGRTGWFGSNPFGPPHAPGRPASVSESVGGAAAALSYVYNFFLAMGVHMPLQFGHLWTLAVEGQFYVLWALLASWLLKRGPKVLIAATVALIALSAAVPFIIWDPHGRHNWIYFGTTPRIQQLLSGALLAELWSLGVLRRIPRWVLRAAALAGTGAMFYLVFGVANDTFKYLGALTAVAGAGFVIVAHLIDDRGRSVTRAVLGSRPLVWLGQRSYAVYLWHWPMAIWTNELPRVIGVPLGLGASLAAAEMSWRLVEAPASRLAHRREERRRAEREQVEQGQAERGRSGRGRAEMAEARP